MTSSTELSLLYKPRSYSMLLKSLGEQPTEQIQKLEEFVARLEEERLKIDAFKRELPLCTQLLTNAMETSRQVLQSQRTNQVGRPVLEEFIPLKNKITSEVAENAGDISADKSNWMASAQLWNQESEGTNIPPPYPELTFLKETDIKLDLNAKHKINGRGSFLPFLSKDGNSSSEFPELALASSHKEEGEHKNVSKETNSRRDIQEYGKWGNHNSLGADQKEQVCGTENTSQNNRKARRCWSPDLHRLFVNALHMLGGSQVATPKQIRQLMKVEGLTNDEVKSHLQKYRLHTRSLNPSPQAAVPAGSQVLVLGGIWVPPEYAAAPAAALYGAHATTTHHISPSNFFSATPPPLQEIYPAKASPPQAPQLFRIRYPWRLQPVREY